MYVRGYVNGYADGDSAMEQIVAVVFKDQDLQTAFKKMPADPQIFRVAQMVGLGKNLDISVAKIENAMSSFYTDYRNAPVCWNEAVQFSVLSLNGEAATEQELAAARKSGAEAGCN
jgi:hypothetical protein